MKRTHMINLLMQSSGGVQYGDPQTLTLQPDATAGVDTYIRSNQATTNFGTNNTMYVGEWSGLVFTTRGLIKFDLSPTNIPANAHVTAATLKLTTLSESGATVAGTIEAYRQLRAWVEGEATWNIFSTGNSWQTAGGFGASDCEQASIGTATVDPALVTPDTTVISISLDPAKVEEWIDGTLTNNGLLLKMATETDNAMGYHSSDSATAGKRPILEVVYQVPFDSVVAVSHTQKTAVPLACDQMGFEELGGLLYYVAGRSAATHSAKMYAYNPADDTWTEKADIPLATGLQSPVVKAVGTKLYCIGGHNSTLNQFYGSVYEYNPADNTWATKTAMPTVREDFGAAVIGTKIYCFGGLTTGYTPTKKLEIYDTSNDTWDTTKADMPDYKQFGDFGASVGGKVYAIGSSNTFADYPPTIHPAPQVWEYDPAGNTWTAKTALPCSASYKEVAVLDGLLYVVSGATNSITNYSSLVYAYNPGDDTWTRKANAPYAARGSGLAVVGGKIYMVGGYSGSMLDYLYELGYA